MSNTQVGIIYQKIIEEVTQGCLVTFEEDGVERKLLEEVRKTWQNKISERRVAIMPWEPSTNAPSSPGPSAGIASRTQSQSGPSIVPSTTVPSSEIRVKPEPGTTFESTMPPANGLPATYSGNQAALQRAGQHLQEKFGTAASSQVNILQARAEMASQAVQGQARLQNATTSQTSDEQRQRAYQQQMMKGQQLQTLQQAQQRTPLNEAQTDGASEWKCLVSERRLKADAYSAEREANLSLKKQMERSSLRMEGGGLMMPISALRRVPTTSMESSSRQLVEEKWIIPSTLQRVIQFDGALDGDADAKDSDEDAINSDLDDPDDNIGEEAEEEGNPGELMLCTYDKVQRVKNKWKCTLKDGILSSGGKEYVFHKAQGEFEW